MDPEVDQISLVLEILQVHHQDSLHHLRQVSEVEGVVALGWSGQEVVDSFLVEVYRCLDDWLGEDVETGLLVLVQESLQNGGEDRLHTRLGELWHPNHVEVPEESRTDGVPTTTWWSASADVIGILDLLEDELLGPHWHEGF